MNNPDDNGPRAGSNNHGTADGMNDRQQVPPQYPPHHDPYYRVPPMDHPSGYHPPQGMHYGSPPPYDHPAAPLPYPPPYDYRMPPPYPGQFPPAGYGAPLHTGPQTDPQNSPQNGPGGSMQGGIASAMNELADRNGLGMLKGLLNFDDGDFWKGALVGAAVVLLATNEDLRNTLLSGAVKTAETIKSGIGAKDDDSADPEENEKKE